MSARRAGLIALALVSLLAPASALAKKPPAARTTLTVFAAASLSEPFSELEVLLARKHPEIDVRFNFAGSQQLAAQIEQGAQADLFASADQRWMQYLADRNKLGNEPRVFAHNGLVVIVPRSNPGRIRSLPELAKHGIKVVIGAAATPVGLYTRQVLPKLALGPDFVPNYAARVMANVVSEEDNVKAVVAKVQLAEADAGFVYRSDVSDAVARQVTMLLLPPSSQIVADYPIAIVMGTAHGEAAAEFLALLGSREGQAVLARHHLEPVAPGKPAR